MQAFKMSLNVCEVLQHASRVPPHPATGLADQKPKRRDTTPRQYRISFIARVKAVREAMPPVDGKDKFTQEDMAMLLGIDQGKYKQYEKRSLMPHDLLVEFCKLTEQHPWFMLTGQSGALSPGAAPRHSPTLRPVPPAKPRNRPSK